MGVERIGPRTDRTCGDCRLCCKVLQITEVRNAPGPGYEEQADGRFAFLKPSGKWCQFAGRGGCSVYDEKPMSCADYHCGWLQGIGEDEDRPDKIKVVINIEETQEYGVLAVLYESYPGVVEKSKRARTLFDALWKIPVIDGIAIIPSPTTRRRLVHKLFGATTHVPLDQEWREGELLVDADAGTVGGLPIEPGRPDIHSVSEKDSTDSGDPE